MSTPATVDHLPGKLNLKFRQGNDFSVTVQIGTKAVSQDGTVTFLPKDITGSTFEVYVAGFDNRGKATVVTPADGSVLISVGHEITSSMRGSVAYELVEIAADKTRKTVLVGLMKIGTPCDDGTSSCHSCGCHTDDCHCKDERDIVPCNPTGVISVNGRTGAVLIDDLIPTATSLVAGIVKVDGVTAVVDANGVLSIPPPNTSGANGTPYILPDATTTQKGGVIVGQNLNSSAGGVISAPLATVARVGVVKPGKMLGINLDGSLDVMGVPSHTHAMTDVTGLNKALDSKPTLDSVSNRLNPNVLPIASDTLNGIVKVDGTSVTIDADGTIHSHTTGLTGGTVTSVALVARPSATGIISIQGSPITTSGNITIALEDQQPHMVLAGPAFGVATTPKFRPLTCDDISDATATGLAILKASTPTAVVTALNLANVATSGSYRDLADKPVIPGTYNLPIATTSSLGGVMPDGSTIKISAAGVISGSNTYTLPVANATTLGGVIPSGNVTITSNGVIDVKLPVSAGTYTLPVANATSLGGVKQGANVTIDATGLLSVNLPTVTGGSNYTLPVANSTSLGGVMPMGNLTVNVTGGLDVNLSPYLKSSSDAEITVVARASSAAKSTILLGNDTFSFTNGKGVGFKWTDAEGLVENNPGVMSIVPSNSSYATVGFMDKRHIMAPARPGANQILQFDGANWTAATLPAGYVLPVPTATAIGGVKKGPNVTIAVDGTIDVALPASAGTYTLPVATSSILGGVKPSGNVTVNANGFIDVNVPVSAGTYTLPAANATRLGGVTVSGNISVSAGGAIDFDTTKFIPRSNLTSTYYGAPTMAMSCGTRSIGIYTDGTLGIFNGLSEISLTSMGQSQMIAESPDGAMKGKLSVTMNAITLEVKDLTKSGSIGVNPQGVTACQPPGTVVAGDTVITGSLGDDRYIHKPATATANQILTYNGTGWAAGNPDVYALPVASVTTLGGVKQGANVTIDGAGLLSVNLPENYALPVANATRLGGVMQGANTTIAANGAISVILPAAANLTGYLTKTTANTLYQPILSNVTYHESVAIPTLSAGIMSYKGEAMRNVTGVLGTTGNTTYLNGITHHAAAPNTPYGTIQGLYITDPATGCMTTNKNINIDPDSVWLNSFDPAGTSSVRVRRAGQVNIAVGDNLNKSSSINLSPLNGAVYTPPANVPIATNMMLNKEQMDSMYFPKSSNNTLGLMMMANGTGWDATGFGMLDLVDAPTVNWNATGNQFRTARLFLTTTRTMAFPTGMIPGVAYNLIVVQNVAGSGLNWDAKFFFPGKIKPVLSTAQYSIDVFTFLFDGTNLYGTMQKSFGTGV